MKIIHNMIPYHHPLLGRNRQPLCTVLLHQLYIMLKSLSSWVDDKLKVPQSSDSIFLPLGSCFLFLKLRLEDNLYFIFYFIIPYTKNFAKLDNVCYTIYMYCMDKNLRIYFYILGGFLCYLILRSPQRQK